MYHENYSFMTLKMSFWRRSYALLELVLLQGSWIELLYTVKYSPLFYFRHFRPRQRANLRLNC